MGMEKIGSTFSESCSSQRLVVRLIPPRAYMIYLSDLMIAQSFPQIVLAWTSVPRDRVCCRKVNEETTH